VREALNLLVDRGSIQEFVYGRGGVATRNYLNSPARFCSPNTKWEFNVDKANQVLEGAGWKRGTDGVRTRDGRPLKFVFQTSTNAPRQKCQQIIKAACQKAGIELELKAVTPAVFFSSDVANPDTNTKFYADLEMFNISGGTDPWFFMNQFCSWEIASKDNKWQGRNFSRWRNAEYDEIYRSLSGEFDPVRRAAKFIRLNELIIDNRVAIPLVNSPESCAAVHGLRVALSAWDSHLWQLKDWYREG
jgi:peptide/nickel transport system substrate-binding protein